MKLAAYALATLAFVAIRVPEVGADSEATIRLTLQNGSVVEATGVELGDEVIEVDLGFDSFRIPREAIRGVETVQPARPANDETEAPAATRLFRERNSGEERDLDTNVQDVSEAVVLVRTPVALGSGFVIHPEGYLITNDHVIAGSNELTVIVFRQATDGLRKDEYKRIRIVATAELLDLALLKIEPDEPEEFATVPLADSNQIVQGGGVFAVGNPMGLERSLSEGIVGLKRRLISGQTYVQTTAPLSPGNSGGPLFNLAGEVIGVNSLKIVAQGAEGLSFSIPVNRVKAFIDDQEAYAFDPLNPNTGFRYYPPPRQGDGSE